MAKRKVKTEADSSYVLKIILYFMLGMFWVRIDKGNTVVSLPIGFVIGLIFAAHEHFQMDRKIEYAVLIVAMFASYWLPIGLVIGV